MLRLQSYLTEARHVIWDWNGTLLSDLQHTIDTVNALLELQDLPRLDVPTYKQVFGFPIRKYYETLGFDFNRHSFEDLCEIYVENYMAGVQKCALFAGARDLLTQVKRLGKLQSVLSASDQDSLDRQMDFHGLRPLLDHAFGIADKMGASKIDRGRELMARSGVSAKDTVLFGDTDHDLEVGDALGVRVILLAHGHQSAERLREVHHTVIEFEQGFRS